MCALMHLTVLPAQARLGSLPTHTSHGPCSRIQPHCVIHGARGMFSSPALASVPCIASCESKWDSLTQYISHAKTEPIPSTPLISGGNDRNQTPGGDPLTTLTSSNRQFSQPSIRSLPLDKMNPILSKYHDQMMHYKKRVSAKLLQEVVIKICKGSNSI